MTTLIVVPTRFELGHLLPEVTVDFQAGQLCGALGEQPVVIGGVGPAATAMNVALALQRTEATRVILAGIAGAYPGGGLQVGDLVQANEEVFGDLGYRHADGHFVTLDAMNLAVAPQPDGDLGCVYPCETWADLPAVRFLTLGSITNSVEESERRFQDFGAAVENMEGAAAAMVCRNLGREFATLRAVSNLTGPRNPKQWQIEEPLQRLGAILRTLV